MTDSRNPAAQTSSRASALVTGASGGIGEELARALAADGHDLILVARGTAALERLAADLRARHGTGVRVEAADLSAPGAARALAGRLLDDGVVVDVLVNNAGFGVAGPVAENDPDRLSAMVALNIGALTDLTRAFLPGMLAGGGAASSMSALRLHSSRGR
ncbi:MAG: hypothetical protein RLY86_2904 [Pseudomonadota bacterium]|jgi:short-subunit dehydrogenase